MRLSGSNLETPQMVLGVKGEPGEDHQHLCSPTDVVLDQHDNIYVADGYVFCIIPFYSF